MASAAIANGAHYLDFTAEQAPVIAFAERLDEAATDAGVADPPRLMDPIRYNALVRFHAFTPALRAALDELEILETFRATRPEPYSRAPVKVPLEMHAGSEHEARERIARAARVSGLRFHIDDDVGCIGPT